LTAEIKKKNQTIDEMLNSNTWKITKPLRKISDIVRSKKKKY
jgi:hypothetical protein